MRQAGRTADHIGGQVAGTGAGDSGSGDGDLARADSPDPGRTSASGRWFSQLPYLAVLAGVAAGLAVIRLSSGPAAVKNGTLVIAGALLLAALARLLLPDRRVGLLAARPKSWDVVALAALGTGLLAAGLIYPIPG